MNQSSKEIGNREEAVIVTSIARPSFDSSSSLDLRPSQSSQGDRTIQAAITGIPTGVPSLVAAATDRRC